MKPKFFSSKNPLCAAIVLAVASFTGTTVNAASVGDIAFTGIQTLGSPDSFSIVALRQLASGDRIYFSDNGWTGTGYRGATAADYDGTEGLNYMTLTANISAGTVINLSITPNNYTLSSVSTKGIISSITAAELLLNATGEQLYAFSSSASIPTTGNPLLTTASATNLAVINTAASWNDSTTSSTGSIPTGLSEAAGTAYRQSTQPGGATYFDVAKSFNPVSGRSQAIWLNLLSQSSNWTTNSSGAFALPTTAFNISSAVNIHWDNNGATAGTGGTGTWDTTTAARFKDSAADTGVAYIPWINSSTGNNHTAVFGGTAGTISLAAAGVTASGLTFDVSDYTIQNNTLTLAEATPTISVTTAAHSATISSTLSGSTGFTKSGAGILNITGTNSSNIGATSVTAGTLNVGVSGTGSLTSAVTVNSTGTLAGSGTVSGTVAVTNGGIVGAGNAAIGTLTTGAATFNNGSIFSWDLAAAGTTYDKMRTPSLTDGNEAGGSIFRIVAADTTFSNAFWNTSRTFADIFTTDGSTAIANWATIFSSVSVVNSSFNPVDISSKGAFSTTGNTLNWTPVPEPSSALAGLLLGAGLLRRNRSQRA